MRKVLLVVGLLSCGISACAMVPTYTHQTASLSQQERDHVECRAQSQQAAGNGEGFLHDLLVQRYMDLCMDSRGYHRE